MTDTRCWGFKANAELPEGWEGKIFATHEERAKAGWVDSPAKVNDAPKPAAAPKGKKAKASDDDDLDI